MRRATAVMAVALTVLATPASMAQQPLDLLTETNAPYNFLDDEGKVVGFVTDLLRQSLDAAQIPHTIGLLAWPRALEIATSRPESCLYSMNRTADREPLFRWLGPVAKSSWTVFARQDSIIVANELDDLRRHPIGVPRGWAIERFLIDNRMEVRPSYLPIDLLRQLQSGRLELVALGGLSGPFTARRNGLPEPKPVLVVQRQDVWLGCHPGSDDRRLDRLEAEIARLVADGTAARLVARY
jgi:polar amino acid transport system substrate-binding protein